MALRFMDGFDHMGTSDVALLTKWASAAGAEAPATAAARTGTHGLSMGSGSSFLISKVLPASGGFVVGVAVRAAGVWSTTSNFLEIREGTTVHLALSSDASGHTVVKRDTTTLATGTTVKALNTWYYIEFKGVIHDTTGSYELRIDGVTELSASSVDTRNAGATGQWDRLYVGTLLQMDDLYVCDLSGASHNDFLGVCKVETLYPQTDAVAAGSNAGLTPSTGTDHGALVDEAAPNTTDYNASATVGAKDTYQYPSLSLTGAVLGVQTNLYVAKSDAGARSVCAVVRSGGTDYDGATVSPSTTFGYLSEVRAVNPATSAAWTTAEVNALEAGMKVTA